MKVPLPIPEAQRLGAVLAHLVFWTYNGLFAALFYFGLIPFELEAISEEIRRGRVPVEVLTLVALGAAVPLLATVLGLARLRRAPRGLLRFFFGVEAPLMLGLLFFAVGGRTLTPPVLVLVLGFLAGAIAHVADVLAPARAREALGWATLPLHAFGAVVGLYIAGLLAFFLPPWSHVVVEFLSDAHTWRELASSFFPPRPLRLFGLLLAMWTAVLLLGVPLGVVLVPLGRVVARLREVAATPSGLSTGALIALGSAVVGVLALGLTRGQAQAVAFGATDAAVDGRDARQAWLVQAPQIREGLVNAFLQDHRYFERERNAFAVARMYEELDFDREAAEAVQDAFNDYARPFVFDDGDREMTPRDAADRYAGFFDADLATDTRDELRAAMQRREPWRLRGAADRFDVDARRVHLESQSVHIAPHAGYAEVEIHDVYRSQIEDACEVRMTFELPPLAAITGLWMGPSADRSQAFPFRVAARGAARRVYEAQVRRRIDPALLEQVGPSQYRLRVFPVPGRAGREVAPDLHIWVRYQTLAGPDGWPLPRLVEMRNLYFDDDTRRVVGDRVVDSPPWAEAEAAHADLPTARGWTVRLEDGTTVRGRPRPTPRIPAGGRVLVVVDRSFSMRDVPLRAALDRLATTLAGQRVRVLLTSAEARGEPSRTVALGDLRPEDLETFGGQGAHDLFGQAAAHLAAHDAVVVLTDGGNMALDEDLDALSAQTPIIVHVLQGRPRGYPDAVTEAVVGSAGALVFTAEDAEAAIARALDRSKTLGFAPGWAITLAPDAEASPEGPRAVATAWAVRALAGVRAPPLDRMARLARTEPVVTPWSSMIVLVNDAQRAALEAAESADDRFDRPVGEESVLPQPAGVDGLSGAPEPASTALLLLAGGGTLIARRRKDRAPRNVAKRDES